MNQANRIKVVCVDCGASQSLHRAVLILRTKPHCLECGSTFLDAATKPGRAKIAYGHSARRAAQHKIEAAMGSSPVPKRSGRAKQQGHR
jgi:transposase-like protein